MAEDQQPVPTTQTDVPVPVAAVPWYQSKIIRGIVAGAIAQIISRVQAKWHVDIAVFGLSVTDIVSGAMDGITAIAVAYTARARINQTATPAVVLTKTQADTINETARLKVLNPVEETKDEK